MRPSPAPTALRFQPPPVLLLVSRAEGRSQRTEAGGRRSGARSLKPEVRGRRAGRSSFEEFHFCQTAFSGQFRLELVAGGKAGGPGVKRGGDVKEIPGTGRHAGRLLRAKFIRLLQQVRQAFAAKRQPAVVFGGT